MRRTLLPISVALVMGVSTSAMAASRGQVAVDLNMRAGPSTEFPIVTTIPGDSAVTIYGCVRGYSWCDVSWRGDRGWVYSDYLQTRYRDRYVPVVEYRDRVDVPIISFAFGPYWDSYYRGRPWYDRRDRWRVIWRQSDRDHDVRRGRDRDGDRRVEDRRDRENGRRADRDRERIDNRRTERPRDRNDDANRSRRGSLARDGNRESRRTSESARERNRGPNRGGSAATGGGSGTEGRSANTPRRGGSADRGMRQAPPGRSGPSARPNDGGGAQSSPRRRAD